MADARLSNICCQNTDADAFKHYHRQRAFDLKFVGDVPQFAGRSGRTNVCEPRLMTRCHYPSDERKLDDSFHRQIVASCLQC